MATVTPLHKNILLVAGDISGDLHACSLMRELKKADPDVNLTAIGGPRMKAHADNFIFDLASMGSNGFIAPLKKMPLWMGLIKQIRQYMETQNPCAIIVVDFYGFNHQVLNMAKRRGIPTYYYVTPQVWASRQYRAKQLARLTKKMYVIYPFETDFHKKFGGNAVFLGNPLLDIIPKTPEKQFPKQEDAKYYNWKLGILPGSRHSEISRLMPVFYQAFKRVVKEFPNTQAYVFALPDANEQHLLSYLGEAPHANFHIIKDVDYQMRGQMDFLLACSGTATLENALLGMPMVVAYKLSWATYHIAKAVIKVSYISLVNLLANKPIVKELIQADANPDALAAEAMSMFQNPIKLVAQREELLKLRASLGKKGVAARAAKDILADMVKK